MVESQSTAFHGWNYSENNNIEIFSNLLLSGFESDLTIIHEESKEEIHVHKLVVMMRSKVFHDTLKKKLDTQVIRISKVDIDHLRLMLKYLYTGRSGITAEVALDVINLAYEYDVPGLLQECTDILASHLDVESALAVFQTGMKLGNKEVMDASLSFICRNAKLILQQEHFFYLTLDSLVEIIQRDDLHVADEVDVFDAVYAWGQAECKRQGLDEADNQCMKMVIRKPLKHVRFPLMNKEDFVFKVATRNILDMEDLVAVQMYFLVPEEKRSTIPGGRFVSTPRNLIQLTHEKVQVNKPYVPLPLRQRTQHPVPSQVLDSFEERNNLVTDKVSVIMRQVDRNKYVDRDPYSDAFQPNSEVIQNMHVAVLKAIAEKLNKGGKALVIESGSGYLAVCLGLMVGVTGKVIGVNCSDSIVQEAIRRIHRDKFELWDKGVVQFHAWDGCNNGYANEAPYDVIVVGLEFEFVPEKITSQLKEGGRFVIPVGPYGNQKLKVMDKINGTMVPRP